MFQSRYGTSLEPITVEEATGSSFFLTMDPTRLPKIELGEPVPLRSTFIHGFAALPARVS